MKEQNGYNGYRIGVSDEFAEVFSHFYYGENSSDDPIVQTLLPSFQAMVIFNFGTPISFITRDLEDKEMGGCMITGPLKHAVTYTMPAGARMLTANLKHDAFYRFFCKASPYDHFHPDEFTGDDRFTVLWNDLNNIDTVEEKINHILDFSRPFLQERHYITEKILAVTQEGLSAVKFVSDQEQLSERSVQMKQKDHFGYSGREMSRYTRFSKAVQLVDHLMTNTNQVNWIEVVEVCGYYDQSQLIHDFKHYLNLNPSKYLKIREGLCNSWL